MAEPEVTIKPQNEFPKLSEFRSIFPGIDNNTVFAYDHVIYTNKKLPLHLIVHEITHHEQQDHYGLDVWTTKYLYDPKFRLKMEIDAYKNQVRSIKDRNKRFQVLVASAKNLSSDLYNNLITYKEALRLLDPKRT